ncbi:DNA-protecting protein DprA [Parashewanella spongiae]|uniref:DNA-protecting protein DprA n=1 Tax=Parashewanella spongiae TaxID=342950 RepID=A0A3A6TIP7_9GAMM|nr:DNA-processing protein DprA [Parashewanella spongiae]MCL1079297.1 DNA-processing protein DprA [Parashewanella spongiae]RJY10539.1 DNA-protecting protein DprA [Parashewanella spongiae]
MSLQELRHALESRPEDLPLSAQMIEKISLNPQKVDIALSWLESDPQHVILTIDDPTYPPLLKQITDPPSLLFVKGNLDTLMLPALAVVGSRAATPAGLKLSYQLSQSLVENGVIVCSGMAAGIDGAAHSGALAARSVSGNKTIAVTGTGVDIVYPKRHNTLYQDIQQSGCVVSEFWPNVGPFAGNFPKRNRIISGLSLGTLVIEASRRSGSLITARLAMEQNRDVFAVPGSTLSSQSQGCHDLIKQGAKLVDCVEDILEELPLIFDHHLEEVKKQHHIKEPQECDLPFASLLASVGYEATAIDAIVEHSGNTIDQVLEQLLELELQGSIASVAGGYVRLKRS